MTHYIDADKLITEIERRKYEVFPTNDGKVRTCSTPDQLQSGWLNALTWVLKRITFLQQEHALIFETMREKDRIDEGFTKFMQKKQEQPEADLDKEIVNEWKKCNPIDEGMGLESADIVNEQFDYIVRHFYKLGFNAGKKK